MILQTHGIKNRLILTRNEEMKEELRLIRDKTVTSQKMSSTYQKIAESSQELYLLCQEHFGSRNTCFGQDTKKLEKIQEWSRKPYFCTFGGA